MSKKAPHTISQILWVTETQQIRSNQLMQKKSIILKCVGLKKFLAFGKEDHSRKKTVPLPVHNSSWPWRNSTFSKISNICWWGATTKNWKISANETIIGDLYELDNFEQKIFLEKKISKLKWQMSFFDRSIKSNAVFWN